MLQDAGYRNTNEEPWGKSADGCVVSIVHGTHYSTYRAHCGEYST